MADDIKMIKGSEIRKADHEIDTASVNDEMGMEIFYDFAITPAIRFISGYQHIWHPIASRVSKHETARTYFLAG